MNAHHVHGWRVELEQREGVSRIVPYAELARVVARALDAAGAPRPGSIALVLSDDAELAELNAAYMGADGPTDVLSFPLLPPEAYPPHPGHVPAAPTSSVFALPPGRRPHLGDVVVSVERAIAQAEQGRGGHTGDIEWSPADELRLLVTHGVLHVCGWDHAEEEEVRAMRALERHLLRLDE